MSMTMTAPRISFALDAERYLGTGADSTHPWGSKNDETHCPLFVKACEREMPMRPLWFLDLGCAGGGLVEDFLDYGHVALGLEGSDWPLRNGRKAWQRYPHSFFCCDITGEFRITDNASQPAVFDVVSAWEVLEHLPEEALSQFFKNVRSHMRGLPLFTGSISLKPDVVEGVTYHVTVKPEEWWRETFAKNGFEWIDSPFAANEQARTDAGGVHFCARRK